MTTYPAGNYVIAPRNQELFWTHVDASGDCWEWTGCKQRGYGSAAIGGSRSGIAHRIAWQLLVGPIPEGLHIDHLCRNRSCVNPDHLEPVTQTENNRRAPNLAWQQQARVTHCPERHEYTPENTFTDSRGFRSCIECRKRVQREWARAYRARIRAAKAAA